MLDIREHKTSHNTVRFADDKGGTGRVTSIVNFTPTQFDLINLRQEKVGHIKFEDIDNLIKALKYAKENWSGYTN